MKAKIHIFLSFFLIISFTVQSTAKSIIYIHFSVYQQELAQTVCENKDMPKSCCEAKCYLEKEIKKEEKRESNSTSNIKTSNEKNEQVASSYNLHIIYTHSPFMLGFKPQHKYNFTHIHSIFHPPSV